MDGPGRSLAEATPLIALLRARAETGEPLTFNALHLEEQGGRAYPFWIDGYDGPITISQRKYRVAEKRCLLAAIRRDVRALFTAPAGWSLIELDFRACHAAIGVHLSGDPQLAADVEHDVHQVTGDWTFPFLAPAGRRAAGKYINNAMLFGATPIALDRYARELLGAAPPAGASERVWSSWWGRYPWLAAYRDYIQGVVSTAQIDDYAVEIISPAGRVSRFNASEVRGRFAHYGVPKGLDGAWRTVFSAVFRAVEGDILDATFRHFHACRAGGRMALPLYDGAVFAAPVGREQEVQATLQTAAERAARDVGLAKLRIEVRRIG